jgi:transposase InsO family protein
LAAPGDAWKTASKIGPVLIVFYQGEAQVDVVHKPRLLRDMGSSYVSGDLAEWLQEKGIKHRCGAPYHLLPGR